ncbi:hypothetical protein JNW90_07510 [Micromonospora sp. STR1s_5]|nr:hypothetical protein [Micromonospora sp. STR1s_5]
MDLNYSSLLDFSEADFVIAGPGALDGISKTFASTGGRTPEAVIRWVTERQTDELAGRGLEFPGLFGRPLQPIDRQNLLCEISKYARVAHPEIVGVSNRRRIKQSYKGSGQGLPTPVFPPCWGLVVTQSNALAAAGRTAGCSSISHRTSGVGADRISRPLARCLV